MRSASAVREFVAGDVHDEAVEGVHNEVAEDILKRLGKVERRARKKGTCVRTVVNTIVKESGNVSHPTYSLRYYTIYTHTTPISR